MIHIKKHKKTILTSPQETITLVKCLHRHYHKQQKLYNDFKTKTSITHKGIIQEERPITATSWIAHQNMLITILVSTTI